MQNDRSNVLDLVNNIGIGVDMLVSSLSVLIFTNSQPAWSVMCASTVLAVVGVVFTLIFREGWKRWIPDLSVFASVVIFFAGLILYAVV